MASILQEFRFAFRALLKAPGVTIVAVLTLALGIGANTAMFSVVNGVLLRPLPFRDASRIVLVAESTPTFPILSASYQNYVDWRDQSRSFEQFGAVRNTAMTLSGTGDPERLPAQMVTANMFPLLGVQPELGRTFTASEDSAGGGGVVLVSHSLWERRFGASPGVVGQTITLDNHAYTIIGVLPPGFEIMAQPAEVFVPMAPWAKTLPDDRSWHPGILPVAKLKGGVSLEQARTEMAVIAKRLELQYPEFDTGTKAIVNRMQDQLVQNVRPALFMLLCAVAFVVLIACTNVANLLIARAASRQREIAIRSALGASGRRIFLQLVSESVLLSVIAGALGVLIAFASLDPLLRLAGPTIPGAARVHIDLAVLAVTALISIGAGIAFGVAPAVYARRVDVRGALSATERGAVSGGTVRLRSMLVVAEVAFAMLLLSGAGLLIRSFQRLSNVSPGFDVDHILIADMPVAAAAHPNPAERMNFFQAVLDRAAALPGVRDAGAASTLPVSGTGSIIHFNIQGRAPKSPHDYVMANYRVVTPGYLKTMGMSLAQGRWLTDGDIESAPFAVVINSTMARTYFPNESAIGKFIKLGTVPTDETPWMQVVGVVGDVRQGLASEAPTEMYVNFRQANAMLPVFAMSLVLRTATDPKSVTSALRSAVHDLDANQPLVRIRTMDENIATSVAQPRFRTLLLSIFAGLAMFLAAIGIYGLMAYNVTQRTREIGVRMALGSRPADIFRLLIGNGLRVTLIGVAVGIAGAMLLTRYIASMLFQVGANDPLTLSLVSLILLWVAGMACFLPARRATRVDPIIALRQD
ncbi:MAG: ABC transporter permease [Terriglobales bacterium]